jgi:hypothetical protein
MGWTSKDLEETVARVERLRLRYDTLKRRLRRADGVDDIERLDVSIQRRRTRIRHLDAQIDRMMEERARLEGEILGCFHGAEALLVDLIDRLEELDGPSWSPEPVPGYSIFEVEAGVVHDGDHPWGTPVLRPGCPSGHWDAPHESAACAGLPCGVLAYKSIDRLPGISGGALRAVAEIALSGRVIEHTDGYRAEVGEIISIVAFDDARWFRTRHTEQIDAFIASPAETFDLLAAPIPPDAMLYVELDLFLGNRR